MAINDIVQTIAEARVDARSLSEFVFKPADFTVTRRLAPSVRTLQYYIDLFNNLNVVFARSVTAAQNSLDLSVINAQGKVGYIESTVQNAINNTAVEGGVLADTFLTATAYHPDTYARTQRSIRADTVSMLDFIPLDLHESIRSYAYNVDLTSYVQKAIDYCVLNNKKLNVPAGGYSVGGGVDIVYLSNNLGANRNLFLQGDGKGLTIFKEGAGATTKNGRFRKMFYFYCGNASLVGDFGHITIEGITFDKNGRNNTNPQRQAKLDAGLPVTNTELYAYEQAHAISFAGAGKMNIKSISLKEVEFVDKIGGGLNLATLESIKIQKVLTENVTSRYHPKIAATGGDGTFGQRGCLEFGANISTLEINNPDVLYAQIEPTVPSSKTFQRSANVSGGLIDTFEWTDSGGYSYASVINLKSIDKFLCRGINAAITNSTIKITEVLTGGIIKITGGTILVNYNPINNKVSSLVHGVSSGYSGYSELWLSNLNIKIDSDDPSISPDGYLIDGGGIGLKGSRKRYLSNITLDPRVKQGVNAYGNGDWVISNSELYGSVMQVAVGGYGTGAGGSVKLINNSYLGLGSKVTLYRNNTLWDLEVAGAYPLEGFYGQAGTADISNAIKQKPSLVSATAPTNQTASIGQIVTNNNPLAGGYSAWVKVAEPYTASSWKGVGLIEATSVSITSGTTAKRPTGVAVGFAYFDTTLGKPIYFKSTDVWVDSTGATV